MCFNQSSRMGNSSLLLFSMIVIILNSLFCLTVTFGVAEQDASLLRRSKRPFSYP